MSRIRGGIVNLRCGDQSVAFFADFLSGVDDAFSVELTNNVENYVFVTGLVRGRVTLTATGPVLSSPWSLNLDQFQWQVIE